MEPVIRFLCDVDGIAANFVGAAIKKMRELSGKNVSEADIFQWDVTHVLDDQDMREASKKAFDEQGFCKSFDCYEGTQPAIAHLAEVTDFHFVTAPMLTNYHWMPERVEWLLSKFNVPSHRIHFSASKHVIVGDFLLDDAEKNVNPWIKHHPNGTALIWDRQWNRSSDVDPRVIRVHSWDEVIYHVEKAQKRG